jgi:hypothetical protein
MWCFWLWTKLGLLGNFVSDLNPVVEVLLFGKICIIHYLLLYICSFWLGFFFLVFVHVDECILSGFFFFFFPTGVRDTSEELKQCVLRTLAVMYRNASESLIRAFVSGEFLGVLGYSILSAFKILETSKVADVRWISRLEATRERSCSEFRLKMSSWRFKLVFFFTSRTFQDAMLRVSDGSHVDRPSIFTKWLDSEARYCHVGRFPWFGFHGFVRVAKAQRRTSEDIIGSLHLQFVLLTLLHFL